MGVVAEYYMETRVPLLEAADRIANEQSAGLTDNDMASFSDLVQARGLAEVVEVEECQLRTVDLRAPTSSPSGVERGERRAATVKVSFPSLDLNAGLEAVLNVVFGEPQNLGVLNSLELTDLHFGEHQFRGPRHGLSGIRKRLRVTDRPLLCAPIKPSTGLDLQEHVDRGLQAALGGADIIKDDELCLDTEYNPLGPRAEAMSTGLRRIEDQSNEGRLYVANLIGRRSGVLDRLRIAESNGAEAVMVAPSLMGFDVIDTIRDETEQLIFAHSAFTLSFTRVPGFGLTLPLWVRLQRLYGADAVLLPSHGGSFGVSETETIDAVKSCISHDADVNRSAPAHSGSMNALNFDLVRNLSGGNDFIFTSGSGRFDHPDGVAAGARALRSTVSGDGDACDPSWLKSWRAFA